MGCCRDQFQSRGPCPFGDKQDGLPVLVQSCSADLGRPQIEGDKIQGKARRCHGGKAHFPVTKGRRDGFEHLAALPDGRLAECLCSAGLRHEIESQPILAYGRKADLGRLHFFRDESEGRTIPS